MHPIEKASLQFPFITKLPEHARSALKRSSKLIKKNKGSQLLSRGDRINGAFLVLAGELDIFTLSEEGRETSLYCASAGESCIFALNALFNNIAYPAWVKVGAQRVEFLYVEGKCFSQLFDKEKAVRDWVFSVQSHRVFDLVSSIEELQNLSLYDRLKSYLARSTDRDGMVKQTHNQIATSLGTSREVISRYLKPLILEGAIEQKRGSLRIVEIETLNHSSYAPKRSIRPIKT